jgi:hypothetical protein
MVAVTNTTPKGNSNAAEVIMMSAMVGVVFIPILYQVSYSCSVQQHHAWMHPTPVLKHARLTSTHVTMQHPGSVVCMSPTQHVMLEIILGSVPD